MAMTRVQKTWALFLATRAVGLVVDGAVLAAAYCGAFALRYDFHAPRAGWRAVALSFVLVFMVHIASLIACGCYRLAWRRISRMDVPRYLVSTAISCAALTMMRFFTPLDEFMHVRPPYSVTVMTFILASAGLIGWRLAWSCVMGRRERADDLLDRKVREMDTAAAARFLGGRTVMVTGAVYALLNSAVSDGEGTPPPLQLPTSVRTPPTVLVKLQVAPLAATATSANTAAAHGATANMRANLTAIAILGNATTNFVDWQAFMFGFSL